MISTVGGLIEALKKFDPSLPILQSDFTNFGYKDIMLSSIMVWEVRPIIDADGDCQYVDVLYPLPVDNSFSAVIL
jgi:hypothetical protein